jgi:hypothetical protein
MSLSEKVKQVLLNHNEAWVNLFTDSEGRAQI